MILTLENYGYNLAQIFVGFELKCSVTFWLGREGSQFSLGTFQLPTIPVRNKKEYCGLENIHLLSLSFCSILSNKY